MSVTIESYHFPVVHTEQLNGGDIYRAGCICGWKRDQVNSSRQNAIRAAQRHRVAAEKEEHHG